jgi:hypothetical protein
MINAYMFLALWFTGRHMKRWTSGEGSLAGGFGLIWGLVRFAGWWLGVWFLCCLSVDGGLAGRETQEA